MTAAIMFQGTGSDVGKSLLVAGLCRAYRLRGLKVLPFKPQNMSNNAAVTPDGGEIGRAQAVQARAAGVAPSVHMNPVLLKPQSDQGSQVVVQGRVQGAVKARDYWREKARLMPAVLDSFGSIRAEADLVLVEGAGSPAEVNLRAGDIANMGFAEAANLPVILIGDIERGGVIASIVGTAGLLGLSELDRLKGFIINKFRGDISLFSEGEKVIVERTGLEALGVVPYFAEARRLPAEDSVILNQAPRDQGAAALRIVVPLLPRISNFDDLDPLIAELDVRVDFVPAGEALPGDADLVILPGSKATRADLGFLRQQGWDLDLAAHLRRGGQVLGLCGGYQILGEAIADPQGIEGAAGESSGLGYLAVRTTLTGDKTLTEASGRELASGAAVRGYEMHIGATSGDGLDRPMLELAGRACGAVSADGRVMGCYLHGIFSEDGFRHAFLSRLRSRAASGLRYEAEIEGVLDGLASHLECHLELDRILALAGWPR